MAESGDPLGYPSPGAACPFCGSSETELISLFGQFLLGSQYYCHACRSVFEAVRWVGSIPDEHESEGA